MIQAISHNVLMHVGPSTRKWIGFLTPLEVLVGVRGYPGEPSFVTFDVRDYGRLGTRRK